MGNGGSVEKEEPVTKGVQWTVRVAVDGPHAKLTVLAGGHFQPIVAEPVQRLSVRVADGV